jgi:hypothetical protein
MLLASQMVVTPHTKLFRLVMGLAFIVLISACTADDDSGGKPVADQRPERAGISDTAPAVAGAGGTESAQAGPAKPRAAAKARVPSGPVTRPIRRDVDDLLDELQTLVWDKDTSNGEEAADLLLQLQLHGADSLAAIRDFLLDDDRSGEVPPELRQALLDVLLSLGLPEVEGVALQLLVSDPAALEVLQLGLYLESVEPGKYSDTILLAAERVLIEADPTRILPAEFFQLLGALGNEQTALLLAEMPWHHEAYASIALASIPDGSGLATLEQDARVLAAGRDSMQGRLAIQLLAQMGPQFPEAAASLIKLAEQGAIPGDVWPHVLDIVAGNWELTLLEPMTGDQVWSHTFYSGYGNQVIYGAVRRPGVADDGLHAQRLYLLDRLQPLTPPGLAIDGGG